jgi:4-hydroxyphenylpyruvate dioxygenase
MLRWAIATVSMGGTLEGKLAAAARAGFRTVEIFENDLTFFGGRPRDVRQLVEDLGLEIAAFQPMRDFEAMPAAARAANFERARRKFDLMQELGAPLLNLCSNVSEDAIDDFEQAAADLAELADLAAARGIRIGYEALAWGRYVKDWMQAWDLVRRADRPNLGVVLDSFHICARRNPLAPIADLPADRVALVQVADAPGIVMDPMSLSRHHRCFPGQGDFPVQEFLDAALRTGYRGAVSLEIFNDQFRGAPATDVARDGMRSLVWLGERLASQRSAPPSAGAAPPPAQPIESIEFVEFAAAGTDADRLSQLIEGLGFARVARHRSKNVDLYRQNDINLVLNREQDGFAHSFYLVHGASVCALALRFKDAKRALDRANALAAPTYWGRVGPGEALIPAVGGVENSLIYFVDGAEGQRPIWDQDFVFESGAGAAGPLTRIDHLSNVVRRSEFLSWLLFYKAVLGFLDEPQVELADPYGAFYSRVIRSPNGAVRIPLNVADGGPTGVSRFIDVFGGGGVQQIAFSTDDLFAFVEQARDRGVPFLGIPDNYYDDLASRYQLPDEQLERMRALDILYDRNRSGEFFHIYTAMFDDRFFFEILQRRGYDQFGAANTPVRLAAQTAAQERSQQTRALFEA